MKALQSLLVILPLCFACLQVEGASTVRFLTSSFTTSEGTGAVEIQLMLLAPPETEGSVDLYSAAVNSLDAAHAGEDFPLVSGTVTFPAGQTNGTFTIPITNDALMEAAERFEVVLTNALGGVVLPPAPLRKATVWILDNDGPVQFSMSAYSVGEGDGSVTVKVVRGDDGTDPVTVDYATEDGTALAGEDYEATSGTVTLPTGHTSQEISIPILNDRVAEGEEIFLVKLSQLNGGAVLAGATNAAVTVVDNDGAPRVQFSTYRVSEGAGEVQVTVLRGGDPGEEITVEYATQDISATAGEDYLAISGTLVFGPEEMEKTLVITILNDVVGETDEVFRFDLAGGTLGPASRASIVIVDNDPGIGFARTTNWVHEAEGEVCLTVRRGNDVLLQPFTVDYVLTPGTADDSDYLAQHGTLSFRAGEMSQVLRIPVYLDSISENMETFSVSLINPTGGVPLGIPTALTATVNLWDATGTERTRFGTLEPQPDGSMRIGLEGGRMHSRFNGYYSLFPVDVSTDLEHWESLGLFTRMIEDTEPLAVLDVDALSLHQTRYYRLVETNLVTPSLPPTGPYLVGRVKRLIQDPTRTSGSLVATAWYPAVRVAGRMPGRYEEEPVAVDVAWQTMTFMDRTPWFAAFSTDDLPLRSNPGGYPVILHSHGAGVLRLDSQELAEMLASHGYIVMAIDHRDAVLSVLPDGTEVRGTADLTSALFQERVADCRSALNSLVQLNATDPVLAGGMDLNHVAAMGYSWGALTAAEICRTDDRCQAAVSLDWGYGANATAPVLLEQGLRKPSLMLNAPDNGWDTLYTKATADAYWVQIGGTEHTSFSTYAWFLTANSLEYRREASRTIYACVLSFLNHELKDQDDGLLTQGTPSTTYPRITNFKRK